MHEGVHSAGCPSGCPLHSPSIKSGMMTSQEGLRAPVGRPMHSRYHTYEKPGYKREDGFCEVGPIGPVYHEFDVQAIESFQHDMDNKDNDNKYVPEPSNLTD